MIEPLGDARIDRAKVRDHLRHLNSTALRVWLNRAIRLLPDEAFPELIEDYVWLSEVTSDEVHQPDLREQTRHFYMEAMAGEYYEDFAVNSRNSNQFSLGTERFAAEHARLIDECIRAERRGEFEAAEECFGLLIELLREIDKRERNIVFFGDEAGAWQINVHWPEVLPSWFRASSKTLSAEEWASRVLDAIADFCGGGSAEILQSAYGCSGDADQLRALAELEQERLFRK